MRFFPRRRNYRKGAKKVAKKAVYKRRTTARKVSTLSRQVRSILRHEEIKSLQYPLAAEGEALTTYYNGNMGSSYTMKLIQLSANSATLPIPQNATASGRVGNKITFVSGKVRLNFFAEPYNSETNPYPCPMIVKIWILTRKDTAQGKPTASLPYFFQAGSTAVSPIGYLEDTFNVINRDLYNVYKQYTIKIGNGAVEGTGGSSANQFFNNNDFSLNKSLTIDFTKYLIKNAKFNDTTTNEPTGRGLWMAMEAVSANNIGLAANAYPVGFLGEIDLRWKDT